MGSWWSDECVVLRLGFLGDSSPAHVCFFFKQKTAYEMRISDWSSDVCSSDLARCCRIATPAAGCCLHVGAGRRPARHSGRPGHRYWQPEPDADRKSVE